MKKLLGALCGAFFVFATGAHADTARVVAGCTSTIIYNSGATEPTTQTATGRQCMASVGSDSLATSQATAGTTATLVSAARTGRFAVTITNLGTVDAFCGGSGVTIANGTLLLGSKGAAITIPTSAAVYCVVGTGTQALSVLETY